MGSRVLHPLLLKSDSLQEHWESWLGPLELWFRKNETTRVFTFFTCLFLLCFFPYSFAFSLALSLYQAVVCNGMSSHLSFSFSLLFVGGLCCWSQQNCWKAQLGCPWCYSLACMQWEGPAIWLKQEGIYILNMPRSWHQHSVNSQWKVWSFDRRADWFRAYGTEFVCWCC